MQLNSSKPFVGLLSSLAFGYLIYIFIGSDPLDRINKTCSPLFVWPAQIVTGGVKIFAPGMEGEVRDSFNSGYGVCRRWVWNAFYADEYARLKNRASQGASPPDEGRQ